MSRLPPEFLIATGSTLVDTVLTAYWFKRDSPIIQPA